MACYATAVCNGVKLDRTEALLNYANKGNDMPKCYMCDEEGTTKEHVPPRSFFPPGYTVNLFTVTSCKAHNLENSPDVEYIRNILTTHYATNDVAQALFQGKVRRSYEHSPKLFKSTFKNTEAAKVEGDDTAAVALDVARFKKVMSAIAYAVYFKENGRTFSGNWTIYSPGIELDAPARHKETVELVFKSITFNEQPTSNPDAFAYGVSTLGDRVVYRLIFYGGFVVYMASRMQS